MHTSVVRVVVETEGDDLIVSWQLEGDPVAVDVSVGPSPELSDHQHELTVPAGETTVRVTGVGPGRHYVSVAPHGGGSALIAADRRVAFAGLANFRDLGGYRTTDGGRVRWGSVFRAEALHNLTPSDLATYEALGMRAVFDLRGEAERAAQPNPFESRHLAIVGRPAPSTDDVEPPTLRGQTTADGELVLHDLYRGVLEHSAPQIGELISSLVVPGGLPAVFHCHAGKDRTGVVAALLLELLGVTRADVLDDYELTARYRQRSQQDASFEKLVSGGMTPEAAAGVLTAPRWAMEQALAELDDRFGTVEAYIRGPAGMSADAVAALRHDLVVPQ